MGSERLKFETFRRTLRGGGPISLKASSRTKREGSVMTVAKTEVLTMAPTTPICEAMKLTAERKIRRIPVADPPQT
ncbi:MAG: hypothetical protein QXY73_00595 [Candidatus Bathyarchaeia archaeon]